MLHINNAKTAKKSARALEKFLAKSGIELGHGKALDAIAVLSGFKDWNSMARATSPEALNEQLADFELSHIEHNEGNDYGAECAAVVHTGFELRYGAEGDLVDYVRVCDPLGREVAYWVSDEWQEDPQLVMGAILGALMRGQPQLRGKPTTPSSQETATPEFSGQHHPTQKDTLDLGIIYGTRALAPKAAATSSVSIQNVPFEAVSNVLINGVPFSLRYYSSEVLGMLAEPAGDYDTEDDCHHNVLELGRLEDGLEWEDSVTLAKLRSLTWCEAHRCFKSPDGDEYVFFTEQRFSPTIALAQPVMSPPTETDAESNIDLPKLYSAEVYVKEHEHAFYLGAWLGIAPNRETARGMALAELWDARLDGTGCHAVVDVEEEDENNHAPFDVVVNGGAPVNVEFLTEGVALAKRLHSAAGTHRVSLRNGEGTEVLKLTK